MQKPDNKELYAKRSSEQKEDADPDERVKENTKVVSGGDKESDIHAGKEVADDDQEEYWLSRPVRKTHAYVPYAPDK